MTAAAHKAYRAGYAAACRGLLPRDCPLFAGDPLRAHWLVGYAAARRRP